MHTIPTSPTSCTFQNNSYLHGFPSQLKFNKCVWFICLEAKIQFLLTEGQGGLTAKMSVKSNVKLKKFLMFVILSVSVSCYNNHRNYPISLKFYTNVYVLREISCIVFGVHCPNSTCTRIHKSISIWSKEGNSLKSILTWLLCMKLIYVARMLSRIVCLETTHVQGHTKE